MFFFVVFVEGCVSKDSLVQKSPTVCVCLILCNLDTSTLRRPGAELGCTDAKELLVTLLYFDFDSDVTILLLRVSLKNRSIVLNFIIIKMCRNSMK